MAHKEATQSCLKTLSCGRGLTFYSPEVGQLLHTSPKLDWVKTVLGTEAFLPTLSFGLLVTLIYKRFAPDSLAQALR